MISVVGTFEQKDLANDFLSRLASDGVSPNRISVKSENDHVVIGVAVDESDHEEMAATTRKAGADSVEIKRDIDTTDSVGRPTLDDPVPSPPIDEPDR